MKRDKYCSHMRKNKGSLYIYHLIGCDLILCLKCEKKLREQVIKQKELEESLK